MALNFDSVREAYEILGELEVENIPSFPEDMAEWSDEEKRNPPLETVLGYDKKGDNGWENIVFITRDPSAELKAKFESLKHRVPNSSISSPYKWNESLWVFGWF